MNDSRVKGKEFWEKVKNAVELGTANGETVGACVAKFGVSTGGWTYAKGRFGWGKKYGSCPKKAPKFTKFVAETSSNGLITVKKGEIEISVHDTESLKKVLEVLEGK